MPNTQIFLSLQTLLSLMVLFSQMCHLLQYLCDCQVRHRIEAIVAFSDDFVAKLQENQRFRYNEVMQALNMSAALTARKTKEFRSPPQEQVQLTIVVLYLWQSSVWFQSFSFWRSVSFAFPLYCLRLTCC